MNTLDIVIPYEEYSKGSIENPKLLLEFDLDEDGDSEKKIGFTDIIKTRTDIIAPQYKKDTVEVDTSRKRIVVYKKNKKIRFSIIIKIYVIIVGSGNNYYFGSYGQTIEKTPDFKIEYNSVIGYSLTLFYDDYNIWQKVFNDERYINEIIDRFFKWFDKNQSKNLKTNTKEEDSAFEFKKMMESGEWKNNIVYESDSCIIIEQQQEKVDETRKNIYSL